MDKGQLTINKFLAALFLTAVFLLLLNLAMQKPLDHDEHQFVASGALMARDGLMMYRDYPYFHLPYLTYIYAAVFIIFDKLLFSARMISMLSAFATITLVFCVSWRLFREKTEWERLLLAAGTVTLMISSPVFVHTSGYAWNHDLPMLLTLGAFLLHSQGIKRENGWAFAVVSGILLGGAVGVRLTFAPLFAPFFLLPILYRKLLMKKQLYQLLIGFSAGFFLALLPAIYWLLNTPEAFWLGNFKYPELNTLFRADIGDTRAMSAFGKLLYTLEVCIQPGNLLIIAAAGFFTFRKKFLQIALKKRETVEIVFIAVILPFLLIGVYAPTPTFKQYFYAPVFFAALAIPFGIAGFFDHFSTRALKNFAILIGISGIIGMTQHPDFYTLFNDNAWQPIRIHQQGSEAAAKMKNGGKVLTFSPIIPLEGGLKIYPEFATGPFAWRTAKFLSAKERQRFGMISASELPEFVSKNPPGGILTGANRRQDSRLNQFAQKLGYKRTAIAPGVALWRPDGGGD